MHWQGTIQRVCAHAPNASSIVPLRLARGQNAFYDKVPDDLDGANITEDMADPRELFHRDLEDCNGSSLNRLRVQLSEAGAFAK